MFLEVFLDTERAGLWKSWKD